MLLLDAARVAHFSLEFDTCRKLLRAAWARGVAGPNALALAASLGRRHECDDVAQAASEALLSAHPDSVQAVKERMRCATTADDLRELLAHPLLAGDIAALSEEMRATRILAEELATEDPLRSIAAAERLRSNLVEPEQLAASLLTCIAHAISAGAIGSA